jgi:DNA-binding transcriptional LysR family regulator
MLEPRRILTFREVARRASFSEAARALSLSQPAVSQQVKLLERQVGTRLLDRAPGGPRTTEAGIVLLEHAEALAERLALADSQLAEMASAERRELRIGAFPSATATLIPEALTALLRENRDVRVQLVEGSTDAHAAAVRAGELHLALCFQDAAEPPRHHPGTRRHELLAEPMLAAVGTTHRLARRTRIELAALAGDVWTAPSERGLVRRACIAAGFEPRIAFRTSDPLAIRALLSSGLAVTLMPRLLTAQHTGIRTLALAGSAPHRAIYALVADVGVTPTTVAALDALRGAAAIAPTA